MKAGLLLVSLSLVALAQAEYDLSCAKSELSIRWPSYESNSEYYVCPRLHGRKMTVNCNPGEVFTFVLQSCTSPNRFIPAPAVENLPLAASLTGRLQPGHPPVLSPPTINEPLPPQPPVGPPTLAPVAVAEEDKPHEEHKPENVPVAVAETDEATPPMPPTPAPTPPLVEKEISKKPSGKKPAGKKKKSPTSNKKTTAAGKTATKKPKAAAGKKTTAQKNGKQISKANRTPKKSVKIPNAKDKKTKK